SVKNEEWKYTNVASIASTDFNPAILQAAGETELKAEQLAPFRCVETAQSELVFVNGVLRKDLSSISARAEQLVAIALADAIADERYREIVWKHLAQQADYVVDGFTALNTALISQGAFIYVPQNAALNTPLHLLFISDGAQTASFPRVLIVAGENSSATLIESFGSVSESQYFTNAVVEVVLENGRRLEHYKVQRESVEAFHVATTAVGLGANSSYDATTINF